MSALWKKIIVILKIIFQFYSIAIIKMFKYLQIIEKMYSEPRQTSKMEHFAKTIENHELF